MWMNKAGAMVGHIANDATTNDARLATVSPAGVLEIVNPNLPPARAVMITDDNELFVYISADAGDVKSGAAVVANGEAVNIGQGLFSVPPGLKVEREFARFSKTSPGGHAIGRVTLILAECPPDLPDLIEVEENFHWSRESGSTAIKVEGVIRKDLIRPQDVNKDGLVVGTINPSDPNTPLETPSRAFIWTRSSGGALLETRVSNMPPNTILSGARYVGDGGHILAFLQSEDRTAREVLLIPQQ
jgi:hypothetical protein